MKEAYHVNQGTVRFPDRRYRSLKALLCLEFFVNRVDRDNRPADRLRRALRRCFTLSVPVVTAFVSACFILY